MILRFPPPYYNALLSWYDSQIFQTSATVSAPLVLPPIDEKDTSDVDDLIQSLNSSDYVVQIGTFSGSVSYNRTSPAPLSRGGTPAASVAIASRHPSPVPSSHDSTSAISTNVDPSHRSPSPPRAVAPAAVAPRRPSPIHLPSPANTNAGTDAATSDQAQSTAAVEVEQEGVNVAPIKKGQKGKRAANAAGTYPSTINRSTRSRSTAAATT